MRLKFKIQIIVKSRMFKKPLIMYSTPKWAGTFRGAARTFSTRACSVEEYESKVRLKNYEINIKEYTLSSKLGYIYV